MRPTFRLTAFAILAAALSSPVFAGDLEDAAGLREKGRWADALAKYEKAAAADPKSEAAALGASEAHLALGHYDKAASCVSAALEANPASAKLLLARARAYLNQTIAEANRGSDGASVRAYASDAIKWGKKAVEADAKSGDALVVVAKAKMYDNGDQDQAKAAFEAALQTDPACFDAHWELGQLGMQSARGESKNKAKWAIAERHFRNAFAVDPKSGAALLHATWCKQWQGVAPAAEYVGDYTAIAKLSPDDLQALSGLWKLRRSKGLGEPVLAAFQKLEKDHPKAKSYALALQAEQAGSSKDTAKSVDDLVAKSVDAWGDGPGKDLCLALMDLGYSNGYLETLQRDKIWTALWKKWPDRFEIGNAGGFWHRENSKDYEKSAEWYVKAAEAAPKSPQVQNDTGLIFFFHLGQNAKAEKYFRAAVAAAREQGMDPSNDGKNPEGVGFRDAINNLANLLKQEKRLKDLAKFAEDDVPEDFPGRDAWMEADKKGN